MAAARAGPVDFHRQVAEAIAILTQLSFNGIPALRALAVLGFKLVHRLGAVLHVFGDGVELGVKFGAFLLDCGELAGQHHT